MPWETKEEYIKRMMPVWTEESRQKALRREEGKKLLAEHGIRFDVQRNEMLVVYGAERTIYFAPATGTYRYKGETENRKCSGTAEFIKIHFPEATRPQDLKKALDEKVRRMAIPARRHRRDRVEEDGSGEERDGRRASRRST